MWHGALGFSDGFRPNLPKLRSMLDRYFNISIKQTKDKIEQCVLVEACALWGAAPRQPGVAGGAAGRFACMKNACLGGCKCCVILLRQLGRPSRVLPKRLHVCLYGA